jgi:hypothetical protein
MTKPVKIARLVMARKKLRDLAAGELAEADLTTATAAAAHSSAQQTLEETYNHGGLLGIGTSRDLLLLEDQRNFARDDVRSAAEKLEAARTTSDEQRARLIARERQLRQAEELHSRAKAERNERIDRHEQGEHDDRSGARSAR